MIWWRDISWMKCRLIWCLSTDWLGWVLDEASQGMSCKTEASWDSKTNADYHDSSIADECSPGIKNKKRIQLKNNRRWKERLVTCNNLVLFFASHLNLSLAERSCVFVSLSVNNKTESVAIRYTLIDQMINLWLFFELNGDERDERRKTQTMIVSFD